MLKSNIPQLVVAIPVVQLKSFDFFSAGNPKVVRSNKKKSNPSSVSNSLEYNSNIIYRPTVGEQEQQSDRHSKQEDSIKDQKLNMVFVELCVTLE